LSQQSLRDTSNEEFLKANHMLVELAKQFQHEHGGQWLWIRMQTDEERAWVRQLLEQSISK
jgi:hypothetical protein